MMREGKESSEVTENQTNTSNAKEKQIILPSKVTENQMS